MPVTLGAGVMRLNFFCIIPYPPCKGKGESGIPGRVMVVWAKLAEQVKKIRWL